MKSSANKQAHTNHWRCECACLLVLFVSGAQVLERLSCGFGLGCFVDIWTRWCHREMRSAVHLVILIVEEYCFFPFDWYYLHFGEQLYRRSCVFRLIASDILHTAISIQAHRTFVFNFLFSNASIWLSWEWMRAACCFLRRCWACVEMKKCRASCLRIDASMYKYRLLAI